MDYEALALDMLNSMQSLHKAALQRRLDEALRGEHFVLRYIARHGEGVLPGEIGEEMQVSTARVAQTLNSMEKKAWLTRQIDPRDRRKILVQLTPEGKAIADGRHQSIVAIATNILTLLGEDDAKAYVRISKKLAGILSAHAEAIMGEVDLD